MVTTVVPSVPPLAASLRFAAMILGDVCMKNVIQTIPTARKVSVCHLSWSHFPMRHRLYTHIFNV